jgi:serine acetyltransferase
LPHAGEGVTLMHGMGYCSVNSEVEGGKDVWLVKGVKPHSQIGIKICPILHCDVS